jgi:hypothetical protein
MNELTIQPLHWAALPELHDVTPLDADDLACMAELRAVLATHGRLGRFALHLVHRHFELADGEVLVEYSDAEAREQVMRVERRDAPALRHAIPTTWLLGEPAPLAACVCAVRVAHGHLGRHQPT